jgi:hypothetical protein
MQPDPKHTKASRRGPTRRLRTAAASPTGCLRRYRPPPPSWWLESVGNPLLDPANFYGRLRDSVRVSFKERPSQYVWAGKKLPHTPSHAAAPKNSVCILATPPHPTPKAATVPYVCETPSRVCSSEPTGPHPTQPARPSCSGREAPPPAAAVPPRRMKRAWNSLLMRAAGGANPGQRVYRSGSEAVGGSGMGKRGLTPAGSGARHAE